MSSKTLFSLAIFLIVLVTTEAGSVFSGSGSKSHKYDLSKPDLTNLYNSRVYEAELVNRPFDGWTDPVGKLSHSGVRVTLGDGRQWLIHKGDGYGVSSQTVVVDAQHMSDKWKVTEAKDFGGRKTVSDFVEAGGSDYRLFCDNCHDGARRMMDQ